MDRLRRSGRAEPQLEVGRDWHEARPRGRGASERTPHIRHNRVRSELSQLLSGRFLPRSQSASAARLDRIPTGGPPQTIFCDGRQYFSGPNDALYRPRRTGPGASGAPTPCRVGGSLSSSGWTNSSEPRWPRMRIRPYVWSAGLPCRQHGSKAKYSS